MKLPKLLLILALSGIAYGCAKTNSEDSSLPALTQDVTCTWIGPEYWTNPLMNWQLPDGRLECTHGGWNNELHSLTHQLKEAEGNFEMTVSLGLMDRPGLYDDKEIFAGFKFAALGHKNDYRSNLMHDFSGGHAEELQQNLPVLAGITNRGRLMIGSTLSEEILSDEALKDSKLSVSVSHSGNAITIKLNVTSDESEIAKLETVLTRESLTGNIALANHPVDVPIRARHDHSDMDHPTFWFSDWDVSGSKISANLEQTYEPILWTQYTFQNKVLKLMAFLVPMESESTQVAYYTSLDLGGVSFALINDRKFKSAPGDILEAMEPLFKMRGDKNYSKMDTINEESFDTRALDREDLTLLGQR